MTILKSPQPGWSNVAACCWSCISPRAREEGESSYKCKTCHREEDEICEDGTFQIPLEWHNVSVFLSFPLQHFQFFWQPVLIFCICSIFSFFGNLFRPRRPNNQGGVPVISPQGYAGQLPHFHQYFHIYILFIFEMYIFLWVKFIHYDLGIQFEFQNFPSFRVRPLITLDERPRNVAAASNNRFSQNNK